jgi:adenylate cyclase
MGANAYAALGEREKALKWCDHALAIAPHDPANLYGAACVYAKLQETDSALDLLQNSIDNGFAARNWVINDGDWIRLRNNPRFKGILQKMPE